MNCVFYCLLPVLSDFDLPFSDHVPGDIAVQLPQISGALFTYRSAQFMLIFALS